MLTVSPPSHPGENAELWPSLAFLDEPEARSLHAFICDLTSTGELPDALRLVSEGVRSSLGASSVAAILFEGDVEEGWIPDRDYADTVVLPLYAGGHAVGQVVACFDAPRTLTTGEERLTEVIAAVAAVTLDNARHLALERKRRMQAEAIDELAPRIALVHTHEELGRVIVTALQERLNYEEVRLLWRRGGDFACLASTQLAGTGSTPHREWRGGEASVAVPCNGNLLMRGNESHRGKDSEGIGDRMLASEMAVPVRADGAVLGVLEVGARSPRAFDESDRVLLTAVAAQAAAVGERLARAQHERGKPSSDIDPTNKEFMSLLVHDLRGPLSIIKGYSVTLLRLADSVEEAKRRRFLAGIDQAANRLTAMVDQIARALRLESGQFRPKLAEVDLVEMVAEVVERLRPELHEHPLALELPGAALPVTVDREHVTQSVVSFLRNAARHSLPGSGISISLSGRSGVPKESGEAVAGGIGPRVGVVEIRDEGSAVAPEQLDHIFAKLPQEPGVPGRKRGGTLDLYIARKVIESHGGQVWVDGASGPSPSIGFLLPLTEHCEGESRYVSKGWNEE